MRNKIKRMHAEEQSIIHTTEECTAANTTASASEGVNPLPKSTDTSAKVSFNPLRAPEHASESVGKPSAYLIQFTTYKPQNTKLLLADHIKVTRNPIQLSF